MERSWKDPGAGGVVATKWHKEGLASVVVIPKSADDARAIVDNLAEHRNRQAEKVLAPPHSDFPTPLCLSLGLLHMYTRDSVCRLNMYTLKRCRCAQDAKRKGGQDSAGAPVASGSDATTAARAHAPHPAEGKKRKARAILDNLAEHRKRQAEKVLAPPTVISPLLFSCLSVCCTCTRGTLRVD